MEEGKVWGRKVGLWRLKILEGAVTLRTGVVREKFEKGWKSTETGVSRGEATVLQVQSGGQNLILNTYLLINHNIESSQITHKNEHYYSAVG